MFHQASAIFDSVVMNRGYGRLGVFEKGAIFKKALFSTNIVRQIFIFVTFVLSSIREPLYFSLYRRSRAFLILLRFRFEIDVFVVDSFRSVPTLSSSDTMVDLSLLPWNHLYSQIPLMEKYLHSL